MVLPPLFVTGMCNLQSGIDRVHSASVRRGRKLTSDGGITWSGELFCGRTWVIPREPGARLCDDGRRISHQRQQVLERIDAVGSAGLNQTHEIVSSLGSTHGLVPYPSDQLHLSVPDSGPSLPAWVQPLREAFHADGVSSPTRLAGQSPNFGNTSPRYSRRFTPSRLHVSTTE